MMLSSFPYRDGSGRTLFSVVVMLAFGACGPRATRVVTGPNGDPAYLVECLDVPTCAARATEVCPAGYDVISAGVASDSTLDLFLCPSMDHSCRHDLDRNQMLVQCKASPTLPGPPAFASAAPPKEAGGFVLGASIDEAKVACERDGHSFQPFGPRENGWLRCTGFHEDPGFRGYALLKPCAERVCTVRLVVLPEPEQSWVARTSMVAVGLRSQFGTPRQGTKSDFVACAADPDGCMRDPEGQVEFLWRWPDGHRVGLVTKANHPQSPLTTVTYSVALLPTRPPLPSAESPLPNLSESWSAPDAGKQQ